MKPDFADLLPDVFVQPVGGDSPERYAPRVIAASDALREPVFARFNTNSLLIVPPGSSVAWVAEGLRK